MIEFFKSQRDEETDILTIYLVSDSKNINYNDKQRVIQEIRRTLPARDRNSAKIEFYTLIKI